VRRPEEVLLVVHREAAGGREFLVMHRAPDRGGYWHLVSGGLEDDESAVEAGRRELAEETGLESPLDFTLLPLVRAYRGGTTEIAVHFCAVEAAPDWEPVIDEEHDDWRWLSAPEAIEHLRHPEPREGVRVVAENVEAGS
jgi:8-oxo-dGTP pyrophosphatase MutT (NUDIX family)